MELKPRLRENSICCKSRERRYPINLIKKPTLQEKEMFLLSLNFLTTSPIKVLANLQLLLTKISLLIKLR
jgi:hypothetical protein